MLDSKIEYPNLLLIKLLENHLLTDSRYFELSIFLILNQILIMQ